jgi:hypothetical protein
MTSPICLDMHTYRRMRQGIRGRLPSPDAS